MKLDDRRYKVVIWIEPDYTDKILSKNITIYAKDAMDACFKTDHYMQDELGYDYFRYYILSVTPVDISDIKVDAEVEE